MKPQPIKVQPKIKPKPQESEGAKALKHALAQSKLIGHAYSMAQRMGIYPA